MAKKFVCVRIQSMNGVNLDQFQFEYDLTWMSFFQDANEKTYARYGGRDDAGPESYLNQESLIGTMREVLKLHETGDVQESSRYEPDATTKRVPSELPTMTAMMSKRKESCIHCHDVKVATLRHRHEQGTLQKNMVFTYPAPAQLGFAVDPKQQHKIASVEPDSAAANKLRAGDKLLESNGQRLLTYGDLTRVLELSPQSGTLPLAVERNGERHDVSIPLKEGWRVSDDPSWRASLHTVGPGAGFWGRPANAAERQKLGLRAEDLALKVTFIWAPHAKSAKVKLGDIVTDLDGYRKNMNMRQFHGYLHLNRNWGDAIKMTAMRNGKPVAISMDLPKEPPVE